MKLSVIIIIVTVFILVIGILLSIYLYKNRNSDPLSYTPMPTRETSGQTKYPLTEQAIMLKIPGYYEENHSQSIFNKILKSYGIDNLENLNCYALKSDTFLGKIQNEFKLKLEDDDGDGNISFSGESNINTQDNSNINREYDIIGAYFFMNIDKFLDNKKDISRIKYYDFTKKITIPSILLKLIFNNLEADGSDNQLFFFSESSMPQALDDFIPRISRFLFYKFGVNINSKNVYNSLININKC